jgi:hypothetical protein
MIPTHPFGNPFKDGYSYRLPVTPALLTTWGVVNSLETACPPLELESELA